MICFFLDGTEEQLKLTDMNCYVDDTFCLFNNEYDALMFFDYNNARQPSIRFTMEREIGKKLSFLILTSVYIARRRLLVFLLII